jgi:hypothetical protein
MACESDKCEKYGMHHDYKNGVETRKCLSCQKDDQPERSKREDCNCPSRYLLNGIYLRKYCRCGALNSMENIERPAEKIWPAY